MNWKELKDLVINDTSKADEVAYLFAMQLMVEKKALEDGCLSEVTDCGFHAPRNKSAIHKKTKITNRIVEFLYNIDFSDNLGLKIQYKARYSRLIAALSKTYKNNLELAKKKPGKKYTRDYCTLKNRPPGLHITEPTPMPVTVAPLEDLLPFFSFLESGEPARFDNEGKMEFKRGVIYTDGRIDMCKQVVGPDHIQKLLDSIRKNSQVKHFLLGNNICGPQGAKAISEFIEFANVTSEAPRIETFYIAGNEINHEGTRLIAGALATNKWCRSLWLKRNPVGSQGCQHLAEMLKTNQQLVCLDLHNCGIGDDGVERLFEGLKLNKSLKHLHLGANGLTSKSANTIVEYLNHINQTGLESLWLGINRLGDDGVKILESGLKNNRTLRRLELGSNMLTSSATESLCVSLSDHPTLIMLDLGFYKSTFDLEEFPNMIDNSGVDHLVRLLQENKNIKVFSILNNHIDAGGLQNFVDGIKDNTTLLHLEYKQYNTPLNEIIKKVKTLLDRNCLNNIGCNHNDYVKKYLRFEKHTSDVQFIDSIYRNKM
jgi:Ran GTPase-activating protein (RanGAP) involved in mRNA processing and transport